MDLVVVVNPAGLLMRHPSGIDGCAHRGRPHCLEPVGRGQAAGGRKWLRVGAFRVPRP